jgi:hypothetical protein
MPQCPHCKTPYEIGQRYCENCESYLLNPEEGDYFCPQCGIRVAPQQEFCHKCNAALGKTAPAAAEAAPAEPPPPPAASEPPHSLGAQVPPPRGLPLWVPGALIAAGFVILILLAVIFSRPAPQAPPVAETPASPAGVSPPPQAGVSPPAPAATPATPALPVLPPATAPAAKPEAPATATEATPAPSREETMKEEVRETLKNLRKAQLEQDIILFMSCYSYLYPSLDKKRKQTLEYWKKYRFMDLEFSLDEIKPLGPENLLAHITWSMQVQNRRNHEFDSETQIFEVALGKELGSWRIRSLKDVTDYEE